nr:tRNA dimethylallyltransferase [Nitrospiraceae bacterium]
LLQTHDPETARLLAPSDTRRIVRALEVLLKTKKPISVLKGSSAPLPYDFIKTGLTRARDELYRLIDERTERMLEAGLLDEVKKVLGLPRPPSKTAMQAIGYKEIGGHLNGLYSYEEAVRLIKRNTRRYAKRQFTWFKKEEGTIWVDVTGLTSPEAVYGRLRGALLESHPEIFTPPT